MSETIKTKLLVIGLLMVLIAASYVPAIAQSIDLDLHIKVDKSYKQNEQYHIQVLNLNTNKIEHILVDNKFKLKLSYDTEYQISVSGTNTNRKIIYINTKYAPIDNWYIISGFELSTNNTEDILAGSIKYDNKLKTFKTYKL